MPNNTKHNGTNDDAGGHDRGRLTARQIDLIGCLIPALFAALPVFLDSFMRCLGGNHNPGNGEYRPGDRHRCD